MIGKVYLSGPMTGLPEWGFPAFHRAEAEWIADGWAVMNPARNFGGETGHPRHEYMRIDMAMVAIADAIAMLPGWENSPGARQELLTALSYGLPVYDASTGLLMEDVEIETVAVIKQEDGTVAYV